MSLRDTELYLILTVSQRGLQKRKNHNIAVIGDGAITGGMAYEAMNHAGFLDTNMIVILNDNQQVRYCLRRTVPTRHVVLPLPFTVEIAGAEYDGVIIPLTAPL